MANKAFIHFPAIYKDGSLLQCVVDEFIDCGQLRVIGIKSEKAWDDVAFKHKVVTGLFIAYEGIEYGTIDIDQDELLARCKAACVNCSGFRLHTGEHSYEFE